MKFSDYMMTIILCMGFAAATAVLLLATSGLMMILPGPSVLRGAIGGAFIAYCGAHFFIWLERHGKK